jgi:hypothetical protein
MSAARFLKVLIVSVIERRYKIFNQETDVSTRNITRKFTRVKYGVVWTYDGIWTALGSLSVTEINNNK